MSKDSVKVKVFIGAVVCITSPVRTNTVCERPPACRFAPRLSPFVRGTLTKVPTLSPLRRGTAGERSDRQGVAHKPCTVRLQNFASTQICALI
jgi:hypothetical protein